MAEKVSLILNNQETSIKLPKLSDKGDLILNTEINSHAGNNIINKIVLVGSEAVGKSSLVEMYDKGSFNPIYKPTIGVSIIEKKLQISKDYNLHLSLLDLGGLKSFAKIRKFYYNYSNTVLILFDYTNIESFNNLSDWIEESRHFIKNKSNPIVLIGNKIDLTENREDIKNRAQALAEQYNFPFFETSSLTGEGIDELFTYLISTLV